MVLITALALLTVAAPPREMGALVLDGLPDIPAQTIARTLQYQNTRSATFADWDGDGILIRTRFGDSAQVHHVAGPGRARTQLTFFKNPVAGAWNLDGHPGGFLFAMDEGGSEFHQVYWLERGTGQHVLLTDGKSRNIEVLPAHRGDRFVFMSNARNGKDMDVHLGTAPRPDAVRLLKELQGSWNPLAWSQDDRRLLLREFRSVTESYLHILELETGVLVPVNRVEGKKIAYGDAVFSRDGRFIVYLSDEDSDFQRLTRLELATGKKEVLTPSLNWDIEHLVASPDGKALAYVVNEEGKSALFLANATDPKRSRRVPLPTGVMSRPPQFDAKGQRLGFGLSVADATSDVFVVDVRSLGHRRWTRSELGGLNPDTFTTPALIRFPSFDGRSIPAWFHLPKAKNRPHPVVILIHGGPEAQERAGLSPTVQLLANELGAAILVPNVRGSTGYGKAYTLLDNQEQREDAVKDIGALLDWVAKRPELDAKRVAVYGGSYGGYMVLASLATFADRLRAGVDLVGISNFVTFLESTQAYRRDLRRPEYGDERDPKMRAFLESISPTTLVSKIQDPLFVVQGQNDPRVPVTEAAQIVKAVRNNGVPVWYLLAKDEGHGFQRKANTDFLYPAVLHFLQTHLVQP